MSQAGNEHILSLLNNDAVKTPHGGPAQDKAHDHVMAAQLCTYPKGKLPEHFLYTLCV